ncbi:Rne/Rng family ribonuclease, partial [Streptomyces variabilis]
PSTTSRSPSSARSQCS